MTTKVNRDGCIKVVIVTNIPVPYREPVYSLLARDRRVSIKVVYCARIEPNRHWMLPEPSYNHVFLKSWAVPFMGQYLHLARGLQPALAEFDADVVITSGYGPVMLQAYAWSKAKQRPHVCFTDGTLGSESGLRLIHRLLRRLVIAGSAAFIGASRKSSDLFKGYGATDADIFTSCLSVQNDVFADDRSIPKDFHLLFVGQFIDRKMPLFAAEVAAELAKRMPGVRLLMVGNGPLKTEVKKFLEAQSFVSEVSDFVQPEELPSIYRRCNFLLFPTRCDPWGVVANEASAAGVPVLTTPFAGVANELVLHGQSGLVLEPDVNLWADEIYALLQDEQKYFRLSREAVAQANKYTPVAAAEGIVSAVVHAHSNIRR